jgi:predicted nucleic acid-binding protein
MIVADTNLTAYLVLDSPYSEQAESLHRSQPDWIAPLLWKSEIRNVFSKHLKHGRMTLQEARFQLRRLESFFQEQLFDVPSFSCLEAAAASGCSSYDCEFVVLAQQNDCPLITMDKKLVKAFPETARLLTA